MDRVQLACRHVQAHIALLPRLMQALQWVLRQIWMHCAPGVLVAKRGGIDRGAQEGLTRSCTPYIEA